MDKLAQLKAINRSLFHFHHSAKTTSKPVMRHRTTSSNIAAPNVTTRKCSKTPDENPKCLKCGASDHPANYRKCPNFAKVMTRRNPAKRASFSRTNPIPPTKEHVISLMLYAAAIEVTRIHMYLLTKPSRISELSLSNRGNR